MRRFVLVTTEGRTPSEDEPEVGVRRRRERWDRAQATMRGPSSGPPLRPHSARGRPGTKGLPGERTCRSLRYDVRGPDVDLEGVFPRTPAAMPWHMTRREPELLRDPAGSWAGVGSGPVTGDGQDP